MKLSKQIGVVIVCLLSVGLLAQPVSMKNWRTQSADDKTGVVIIQGDQIELIDGKGTFYEAKIIDPNPKKCKIEITKTIPKKLANK